jgi:hypothetical protein
MFSSVATSQTHEIKMMFMMQEIGVLIFSIGKKTHTHTHIYIYSFRIGVFVSYNSNL